MSYPKDSKILEVGYREDATQGFSKAAEIRLSARANIVGNTSSSCSRNTINTTVLVNSFKRNSSNSSSNNHNNNNNNTSVSNIPILVRKVVSWLHCTNLSLAVVMATSVILVGLMPASTAAAALSANNIHEPNAGSNEMAKRSRLSEAILGEATEGWNANNDRGVRRTRLRKRHSDYSYLDGNDLHKADASLAWENPCDAVDSPTEQDSVPLKHRLKVLQQFTKQEYNMLNTTLKVIDISGIKNWQKRKYLYGFLPKIQKKSKQSLLRWHRNIQVYVAAFLFLHEAQYKWDMKKLLHVDKVTAELHDLLTSARGLLCEIETTVRFQSANSHNLRHSLITYTREQMLQRMKLRTLNQSSQDSIIEADSNDLLFVKFKYYRYVSTLWRVLRRLTKKHAPHHRNLQDLLSPSLSSSSSVEYDDSLNLSDNSLMNESSSSSASSSSDDSFEQQLFAAKKRKNQSGSRKIKKTGRLV